MYGPLRAVLGGTGVNGLKMDFRVHNLGGEGWGPKLSNCKISLCCQGVFLLFFPLPATYCEGVIISPARE